jgi:O-antigen/teichoic acid export membrane protein
MARLSSISSGTILALGNVYGVLSTFAVLSIVFNSVDLKTFGSISLLLTSISIFQTLFNTQSWQGILNSSREVSASTLRRCLLIDAGTAVMGSLLLALCYAFSPKLLSEAAIPSILMLIIINVALIPPGALIAVIRKDGRFARQALIDITASTLKIAIAFWWLPGSTSLLPLALALVIPESLRWLGYLALSASRLTNEPLESLIYKRASQTVVKDIYRFSVWGMLTEIIHLPTAHIDKLMVSTLLGLESLAIWDILKRCATAVVQGTAVINQMLFPYFLRAREDLSSADLTRQCFKQCLKLGSLLLLFYGIATLTLPIWLPLAFHVDQTVWPLERLQLIFGLFALVLTFVLGATPIHPLFLSLNHSSKNFRISLVGNLVFFMSSVLLLPWLGLFGTSLAILSSDAFIIAAKIRILRKSATNSMSQVTNRPVKLDCINVSNQGTAGRSKNL